jgi:Flp pilus assembly protein TadG
MRRSGFGRNSEKGSTLVESAVVAVVFILLLVSLMEFGWIGFAYNSVSFAAQRAARFASVRGASSGHAAASADVQANALGYIVALDTTQITVATTWTPDNKTGSTVQVKVSYSYQPFLLPVSSSALTLQTTSQQTIIQ